MFIELVESDRKAKRSLGGATASVLLHATLISLAIAATASARTQRLHTDPGTRLTYLPQRAAEKTSPKPARRPATPGIPTAFQSRTTTLVAPVAVTPGIPEPALVASAPIAASGEPTASIGVGDTSPGEGSTGVLTQFQVDREVRAFPSNRAPAYPDALRANGTEGEVCARFVVDESGRVDMKTFEIISASSPAFSAAVRNAVQRARFQPAEAAGRRVAQLVEQRFQFRLDRK